MKKYNAVTEKMMFVKSIAVKNLLLKHLMATVLITFMLTQPLMANSLTDVRSLVEDKIGLVMDLLKKQEGTKEVRNKKIIKALIPVIDFNFMAKISLGKKWKTLTRKQKRKFAKLFTQRVQNSLVEKLDLYTDETVVFQDAKKVKKRIHIMVELVSAGDKIQLLFKFKNSRRRGWRAYDLEIEGVSVMQTYRKQFHGELQKGSIEDLIQKLSSGGLDTKKK